MENALRESDYKQLPESTLTQEANERYTDTLSSAIDDSVSLNTRSTVLRYFKKRKQLNSWATIQYYEGSEPKGRQHECLLDHDSVIIDAGCNPVPCGQRFSINAIKNLSLAPDSVHVRNKIKDGLVSEYKKLTVC